MPQFQIAENKVFDVDGHDFLFLVNENTIFELDPDTKKLLGRCAHPECLAGERFFGCLEGSEDEKAELLKALRDRRIIVEEMEEKSLSAPSTQGASVPLGTLILTVTDDCNLGCLYCYHNDVEREGARGGPMTPATARSAVDFLFENSGDLSKVVIVFFGGEPFLNLDLMASAVDYAREKADGREVDFAVTTNATLLNDKAERFIKDNNIGVTVSIDGTGDAHDRCRRFPDGSPSFAAIEGNLKRLLGASNGRPVVARATLVKDHENLAKTADELLGMGFAEVGFAPATTGDVVYQLAGDDMNRLLAEFGTLSDRFLETALNDGFYGFSNIIDLLVELHEGHTKSLPCGAGEGLLAVDTTGRLHLCQRLTGEGRPCLGDVFGGIDRAKANEFRVRALAERERLCNDCWAKTICAGGCYHEALVRQGSPTSPNKHYCEWIRDWIEIGMGVYGRLAVSRPDYLDKLSALRGHVAGPNSFGRHVTDNFGYL